MVNFWVVNATIGPFRTHAAAWDLACNVVDLVAQAWARTPRRSMGS
jgi:hypothetical protein